MNFPDRSDYIERPGGDNAFQLSETRDFEDFRRVVGLVPDRVSAAMQNGVRAEVANYLGDPNLLLRVADGGDGLVDDVLRQPDGTLVVACLTEMPGVSAAMWDWWFSWHSYASRRYRLWHPEDHLAASVKEDRRHVKPLRDRYVGNTSYVDELVGGQMSKLAITFRAPDQVGLDSAKVDDLGVAVCARISSRPQRLAVGHLIHLIEDTPAGSRMHSRFHLGDGESTVPVVGKVIDQVINSKNVRRRVLPDHSGTALLYHCAQEMNHLASILPAIYERFGDE